MKKGSSLLTKVLFVKEIIEMGIILSVSGFFTEWGATLLSVLVALASFIAMIKFALKKVGIDEAKLESWGLDDKFIDFLTKFGLVEKIAEEETKFPSVDGSKTGIEKEADLLAQAKTACEENGKEYIESDWKKIIALGVESMNVGLKSLKDNTEIDKVTLNLDSAKKLFGDGITIEQVKNMLK